MSRMNVQKLAQIIQQIENGASVREVLAPVIEELGGNGDVARATDSTEVLILVYIAALAIRADL